MKLALIDIDGPVADSTKRFEIAETKREFYRQHLGDCLPDALANPINHAQVQKGFDDLLENLYWQTAFNPDLVRFDTPVEGAIEAVATLERRRYRAVFLTSRPESMREVTVTWLYEHSMMVSPWLRMSPVQYELIMKSPAFQYVKTTVWKAGMVQTLHRLYGADAVLVIDDSPDVQKAVLDVYPDGGAFGIVRVVSSLAEAVSEGCRQCGRNDLPLNQQSGLCVRCTIDNETPSQAKGDEHVGV